MAKNDGKKEQAAPTTAMTASQSTAVVVHEGYGEDAGKGRENQTIADKKVPFVQILQPNSPQCTAQDPHPMAKPGNMYNTVTGEFYDGKVGVVFTPATTKQMYVEWTPRDEGGGGGGGFRGQHEPNAPVVNATKELARKLNRKDGFAKPKIATRNDKQEIVEGENVLIDTRYVPSVLHTEDGGLRPVMLAFKSTHIKPYRDLNSKLEAVRVKVGEPGGGYHEQEPPLYAHRVRMTTEYNKRDQLVWYTPKFEPAVGSSYVDSLMLASDPAFKAAKELGKQYNAGLANVDYASQGSEDKDEDLPF